MWAAPPRRKCQNCGQVYSIRQIFQKYCSKTCKNKAAANRQVARRKVQYHNDPAYRAREIARSTKYYQARMDNDPEFREKRMRYFRKRNKKG